MPYGHRQKGQLRATPVANRHKGSGTARRGQYGYCPPLSRLSVKCFGAEGGSRRGSVALLGHRTPFINQPHSLGALGSKHPLGKLRRRLIDWHR